jgi:hypothetical protein
LIGIVLATGFFGIAFETTLFVTVVAFFRAGFFVFGLDWIVIYFNLRFYRGF